MKFYLLAIIQVQQIKNLSKLKFIFQLHYENNFKRKDYECNNVSSSFDLKKTVLKIHLVKPRRHV